MIKIVDIADELWREINQNPDYSIAYIAFWLRANLGKLNNLILTCFTIDPVSLEIVGCFGLNEKDIFKTLFMVKYYENLMQKSLYGSQFDLVTSISDGDGKITKLTPNELSKTYLALKKDAFSNLLTMANLYKYSKTTPTQITGTDAIPGWPDIIENDYSRRF